MKRFILFIFLLPFIAFSCEKEEVEEPIINENQEVIDQFVGSYTWEGISITGFTPMFDEEGYFIGYTKDTLDFELLNLDISQIENTDTLLIDGIIFGRSITTSLERKAFLEDDGTLVIDYNDSDYYRNDYLKGIISRISTESIYVAYNWDNSDTYSEGAVPYFGNINGIGTKE